MPTSRCRFSGGKVCLKPLYVSLKSVEKDLRGLAWKPEAGMPDIQGTEMIKSYCSYAVGSGVPERRTSEFMHVCAIKASESFV